MDLKAKDLDTSSSTLIFDLSNLNALIGPEKLVQKTPVV